jgi:hypothetical protein
MVSLSGALLSSAVPLYAQQLSQDTRHEQHQLTAPAEPPGSASGAQVNMKDMMARLASRAAKLEELVAKMNAAAGEAKTDAIAELLTALVQDQRNTCGPMMSNMMSGRGGHGQREPSTSRDEH